MKFKIVLINCLLMIILIIFSSCSQDIDNLTEEQIDDTQENINIPQRFSDEYVINTSIEVSGEKHYIAIRQEEIVDLPGPSSSEFDYTTTGFHGSFTLCLLNKDQAIIDSINLNEKFDAENIGFLGSFDLLSGDYNADGKTDYNIGVSTGEGMFAYLLFSINDDGKIHILPLENKLYQAIGAHHSTGIQTEDEGVIIEAVFLENTNSITNILHKWNGSYFEVLSNDNN